MCGKEMKLYWLEGKDVTIGNGLSKYNVVVCPKCSKKLKEFINFEQVKNNKRRCEDE
jgi:hypothetical protein